MGGHVHQGEPQHGAAGQTAGKQRIKRRNKMRQVGRGNVVKEKEEKKVRRRVRKKRGTEEASNRWWLDYIAVYGECPRSMRSVP